MSGDKDSSESILGEIRILEQNLTHILMQKQAVESELGEILNAKKEVESSEGEIYSVAGSIMIRSAKEKVLKELEEKKKLAEMHLSAMEKQEKLIQLKSEELRKELEKEDSGRKNKK